MTPPEMLLDNCPMRGANRRLLADCKAQRISLVLLPALPLDHRSGHGRTAQKCSTARECAPVMCLERGHVTYVQLSRKPFSSSYRQTEH